MATRAAALAASEEDSLCSAGDNAAAEVHDEFDQEGTSPAPSLRHPETPDAAPDGAFDRACDPSGSSEADSESNDESGAEDEGSQGQDARTSLRKSVLSYIRHSTGTQEGRFSGTAGRMSRISLALSAAEDDMDCARRRIFIDVQNMKANMKEMLYKPEYNVTRHYKKVGLAQAIARSNIFDHVTLAIIALNTIYIGLDTNFNQADLLLESDLVFILAENLFSVYFIGELLARFAAFELKRNCCRDAWFVFDAGLCTLMIADTWLVPFSLVVLSVEGGGGASGVRSVAILKLLRILRLLRMARMAKLLKAVPEMMVIIRAMATAMRTVVLTLTLLLIVVYVFGIMFTEVCKGTKLEEVYFKNLLSSMHTLLIASAFPDQNDLIRAVANEHFLFYLVLMFFLMLTAVTIMNMMIGVLVEVVNGTSGAEKEAMEVQFLRDNLLRIVSGQQNRQSQVDPLKLMFNKLDFADLLNSSETLRVLAAAGVDPTSLVDLMEMFFQDNKPKPFLDLLDEVLQLRSSNNATVKDLVTLRKFMSYELTTIKRSMRRAARAARANAGLSRSGSAMSGDLTGAEKRELFRLRAGALRRGGVSEGGSTCFRASLPEFAQRGAEGDGRRSSSLIAR